jgi:hypothetical protein
MADVYMDRPSVGRVNELVNQFESKFPALMFLPSLKTMDGIEDDYNL